MKKYIFWLVLLLALAATACKKKADPEPPALPPETQTGANTFGCYINGVPWKPSNPSSCSSLCVTLETGGIITIFASYSNTSENRSEVTRMFSANLTGIGVGTYPFLKNTNQQVYFTDWKKNIGMASYDTNVEVNGMLTITKYDIPNRIVSGKFWYTLRKMDGSLEIKATEGRFDCYAN